MIIRFEKSGGFTGIPVVTTVDTSKLPPREAAQLLEELDQSGLLDASPDTLENNLFGDPASGTVDLVKYELTLEIGSNDHTFSVTEDTVPDTAMPLFRHLTLLARNSGTSTSN